MRATDLAGNVGPLYEGSDVAGRSGLTVPDNYGEPTGRDLSHINFSEHDEPNKPSDVAAAGTRAVPLTAAAAYKEDHCSGSSPCGTYDRKAAARYARYWWSRRNMDYDSFANDCTNFVSQALKAGGMRFIRTGGFNDSTPASLDYSNHYKHGHGSWWSAIPHAGRLSFNPDWTESFVRSQTSHDRMLEFDVGRRLLTPERNPERPRAGDVIYYRLAGLDHDFSHAAIVSRVTRKQIYVAQHTSNYEDPFSDVVKRLNQLHGSDGWTYEIIRPTHTAYDLTDRPASARGWRVAAPLRSSVPPSPTAPSPIAWWPPPPAADRRVL